MGFRTQGLEEKGFFGPWGDVAQVPGGRLRASGGCQKPARDDKKQSRGMGSRANTGELQEPHLSNGNLERPPTLVIPAKAGSEGYEGKGPLVSRFLFLLLLLREEGDEGGRGGERKTR